MWALDATALGHICASVEPDYCTTATEIGEPLSIRDLCCFMLWVREGNALAPDREVGYRSTLVLWIVTIRPRWTAEMASAS